MVTQSYFNITANSTTAKQLIPANLNNDNQYNHNIAKQVLLTSAPLSGIKLEGLNIICVPEYFSNSGAGGLEGEEAFRTTDCWGRLCF